MKGISRFSVKGCSAFFCRLFNVSQDRAFRSRTLQCFRDFGVSKNFMHNKAELRFSVKNFCLTVPKDFVGEHFCVS